jgi:protein phosphatase 4 regulatory subunit 3
MQKANHRRYLRNGSRYKEVVPISDTAVRLKIHSTWRLQYLKDVVLARILDDPTFSVLNSLIFFNQVAIVSHLQANTAFLEELFHIIDNPDVDIRRKKDAVGFIQQCCAIAKNLQAPTRASLYNNFIENGLLSVVNFALLNKDASIRIAGTDILVAMIDHDAGMVRSYIFKAIAEKKTPLTDTLIELLLVEVDLGVKAQASDAIKILLEQQIAPPVQDVAGTNGEVLTKIRVNASANSQTESFIQNFFDGSANKLFQPLKDLERRKSCKHTMRAKVSHVFLLTNNLLPVRDLSFQEVSLLIHLVEILMFLTRQHMFRSKYFIFSEGLAARIAQLLTCPQKHLKLSKLDTTLASR